MFAMSVDHPFVPQLLAAVVPGYKHFAAPRTITNPWLFPANSLVTDIVFRSAATVQPTYSAFPPFRLTCQYGQRHCGDERNCGRLLPRNLPVVRPWRLQGASEHHADGKTQIKAAVQALNCMH
jgi:hypothetical protein